MANETDQPATASGRRPRSRRGQGELLRAEIIDVASRMLAANGGTDELSLRAVAREVGIATTSIYLHFRDIDALTLAVKVNYLDEFEAELTKAVDAVAASGIPAARDADPAMAALRRVRAWAHQYVRYGLANPGRYFVMFSARTLPPELAPVAIARGVEVFAKVRAEAAVVVGRDDDADLLAVHLWTALHGMVMLRGVRRAFPWPDLDHDVDDLIDRLLPINQS